MGPLREQSPTLSVGRSLAQRDEPALDGARVRLEAFRASKDDGRRPGGAQIVGAEAEDRDDLQEIVDVHRRRKPRRTASGHDVARAGGVVADGLGVELAQKDAAGVTDAPEPGPRIAYRQAQVLAGEGVGEIDRFFEVDRLDDTAAVGQRLLDDGAAREGQYLRGDGAVDGLR